MHPTAFFDNVRIINKDLPISEKREIIDRLKNIHPMNFISSDITFSISEIEVSYTTKKGNRKKTKKYAIQKLNMYSDTDINLQAKIQAEADIEKFNIINKNSMLKDFVVENAQVISMAVLRIE